MRSAPDKPLDVDVGALVLRDFIADETTHYEEVRHVDITGPSREDALAPRSEGRAEQTPRGLPVFWKVRENDIPVAAHHLIEKQVTLRGMRLKVVVHEHDQLTVHVRESGDDGVMLAKVPRKINADDVVVLGAQAAYLIKCGVR